jgi:Helix-turn-helix domain
LTDQAAKQFLSPADVSSRYQGNISVRTLANWRSQGTGPAFTKIGGSIMYPLSRLLEWEDRNTVNSTSQYRGNDR